ncbi:MAG TPA: phosphoenolpyruvate mutase [Gammaproteobacteria bacterium]
MMTKTQRFRQMLASPELEFICEAHNGLSAKIVEEAGFHGIWGSGFSLSAQFGVRDNNEASWTQVVDMLEFMADATSIPIMLDGDTGYGNFNNLRRLVRKLEQRGVAAVCIEDKLFPKTNSFLGGEQQALADIDEFCGKLKAGKDAQTDPDFSIVARIEAFIAGLGLDEALRRAEAYHAAGADAVLVHSGRNTADEILAFMRAWDRRCPVVIVPTRYCATPTEVFQEAGVSLVIWANQLLRASVTAMQQTAQELRRDGYAARVDGRIAPMAEVFRIQGADELEEAERRYLPAGSQNAQALVLAATQGEGFGELTAEAPKAMIPIDGEPLLGRALETYRLQGVTRISVVRGFGKQHVNLPGVKYVDNDDWASTGELVSLGLGLRAVRDDGPLIVSYGDVLFHGFLVPWLLETPDDLVLLVDESWQASANRERPADYVTCSEPYSRRTLNGRVQLERMDEALPAETIHGEWMGFLKIAPRILPRVRQVLDELLAEPGQREAKLFTLFNRLVERGETLRVLYTSGHWLDVDSLSDVVNAGTF